MSVVDGLREAARVLREQAAFLHARNYGETEVKLLALSRQFDGMADAEIARVENEPTEPRVESVKCPSCKTDVMLLRR